MYASIIAFACTLIAPHDAGQKADGYAIWSHPFLACEQDNQGASVIVSAMWPNFQSNRLVVSDFDPGSTASGVNVCIRVRQDRLGGDGVYSLYITPTVMTKGGEYTTLIPAENQNIPQDEQWTVLRYPLNKPVADWSTTAVSWVVTSSLIDSAGVIVDAVWVE